MKRPSDWRKNFLLGPGEHEVWQNLLDPEGRLLEARELLSPAVDVYETSHKLILEVELPGVEREAIDLYTVQNVLFIEVDKRDLPCSAEGRVNYLCMERKFGKMQRRMELPAPCNPQQVKARFKNGVLTVEFEKISDRRGRRQTIPIEP